ncbi:MAG: UDP-glucose 6-dehydrogenase [Desulfonauticus sp. 38_4375]|nr:MAG: UDP-glucose 6-dehydrogenase [Desulfonauticus sp. 38_4375]
MKITVVGLGHVGLSLATLFSQKHEVIGLDISKEKVDKVNQRICPLKDREMEEFFKSKRLNLKATTVPEDAYENAHFIFIATPTDFNPETNHFDTSSIDKTLIEALKYNDRALIVIKSTVPIGYTSKKREELKTNRIMFSPEFLREGKAVYDNLYPSRVIVGDKTENGRKVANLLADISKKKSSPVLLVGSTEAEAIKLFANAYLAMRVAFFNELDTFAELKGLNTREIVEGVCLDPRIGNHYNNPSFGYGGYCLPKDTNQLAAQFNGIPHEIITAIVRSNQTRKRHIADMVIKKKPKTVGIYRLTMKKDSDNFRNSSILDILDLLKEYGQFRIIIYEPLIKEKTFKEIPVVNNLEEFKQMCDLILANRMSTELNDVKEKVYTRDLFNRD